MLGHCVKLGREDTDLNKTNSVVKGLESDNSGFGLWWHPPRIIKYENLEKENFSESPCMIKLIL